jgi:hypothetical protein
VEGFAVNRALKVEGFAVHEALKVEGFAVLLTALKRKALD